MNENRKSLPVLPWVLGAIFAFATACSPAAEKPNIVHIMVDDLGWELWLGPAPNQSWGRTPIS